MATPRAPLRICSLAVAATMALVSPAAMAAAAAEPAAVTPASAQATRGPIQQNTQLQLAAGEPLAAAMQLDAAAAQHGDPVLFLDAADAYYAAADASRDVTPLDPGRERVKIALDILYFLRDPAASDSWQPLSDAEVEAQINRANDYLRRANELQDAIISEAAMAEVQQQEEPPSDKPPGRGLIIAGAVLTGVGVAGLGVGAGGLAIGNAAQQDAEDPTVYGDALKEVDNRGDLGNGMAWGGLIGGGVLTVVGVALLVVGVKKKRAAGGGDATARVQVFPTLGGVGVRGRF